MEMIMIIEQIITYAADDHYCLTFFFTIVPLYMNDLVEILNVYLSK
jgi:hypothetical protein